jgi:hypothetical protein
MKISRACLFAAALSFSAGIAGKAMASDPVVGDSIAPPVNVNIGLLYNVFSDAGTFGALHGSNYSKDTKIEADITVARYIRTFEIGGFEAGAQIYDEYYSFLGQQTLGERQLGLGGLAPYARFGAQPLGAGRATLSANSGFAQPNLGAFIFPVKNPAAGQYLVIAPWISPPISSYNKNDILNPSPNAWVYEMEVGYRQTILGTQTTPNLSLELWGEVYGYGSNSHSALDAPYVTANSIPAIDAGVFGVKNPVQTPSSTPATFREQPTEEIHVYAPYIFNPATLAFVAPGFYQSFGGKQTYKLSNGAVEDSGNRTNETQLRLNVGSFVSPTTQIELLGEYDIAAHGQQLARNVELRIATFF